MKQKFTSLIIHLILLCPILAWSQPSDFDISGTIKTVEQNDDREMDIPRGDVEIENEMKILEINLRRTDPTVSETVMVHWAVVLQDTRGRLQIATRGKQKVSLEIGIPVELKSQNFSVKRADYDFEGDDFLNGDMEQEVEGYAIVLLNAAGKEVGALFQPGSMETNVRKALENADSDQAPSDP